MTKKTLQPTPAQATHMPLAKPDYLMYVRVAQLSGMTSLFQEGFIAKGYPEYVIEMKRVRSGVYDYIVTDALDKTVIDKGRYRRKIYPNGKIYPPEDAYGEVAKINMLAFSHEPDHS